MPPAARVTDPVEHGLGMLGMIAGMVVGAVIGVAILAATIATGGAALAIALAAVGAVGMTAGGGLAGGQLANGLSTLLGISGITSGNIIPVTSPDVHIGFLPAARATVDGAACSGTLFQHFAIPKSLIAQGSETVFINNMPSARKDDKLACNAKIQKGFDSVVIGGPPVTYLEITDNEAWLKGILEKVAIGAAVAGLVLLTGGVASGAICGMAALKGLAIAAAFMGVNEGLGILGDHLGPGWRDTLQGGFGLGSIVAGGMSSLRSIRAGRPIIKDPIDMITGEVCVQATDFELPGTLPVTLYRAYASGLDSGSCFGWKWRSTWGQWVAVAGMLATLYTDDGRAIAFELDNAAHADLSGWVRNPNVNKYRMRATENGYVAVDEQGRFLHFEIAATDRWMLSQISDRNGNHIDFEYNSAGALRHVTHSGGYSLRVEGAANRIERVLLQQADETECELARYEYDYTGNLAGVYNGSGKPLRYEYDIQHRITRWQDRKISWYNYRYDPQGRVVQVEGPAGFFDGTFEWDPVQRTNKVTDAFGTTTFIYNDRLQLVERREPDGAVTRTLWDSRSNKLQEIDPMGRAVTFHYDADGNVTGIHDALKRSTAVEYNEFHQPELILDAAGNLWRREYDSRGNLTHAIGPHGETWTYGRDSRGSLVSLRDPAGNYRSFRVNSCGLPVSVTDWAGQATTYARDDFGRAVRITDPLGGETALRYNRFGKIESASLPDGGNAGYWYDDEGNLVRRRGPDGKDVEYKYGIFDLLTEVVRPSGGRLKFRYDSEGRLVRVTNESGEHWDYMRDRCGRVVREREFSGRSIRYDYDPAGDCIARTNGNGEFTEYLRDPAGQIVQKASSDGRVSFFEYDELGRLAHARNGSCEVSFERDAHGRVLAERVNGRLVESKYDERGLRVSTRFGTTGEKLEWALDANGGVTELRLPGRETMSFRRDALGRETERRTRKGFFVRQDYDPMSRLTSQWVGLGAEGPEWQTLGERAWSYDANGDPIELHDSRWGTDAFSYDMDGRLASATSAAGKESFDYDEAGNIARVRVELGDLSLGRGGAQRVGVVTRYNGAGGRLERTSHTSYHYDSDGRVTEKVTAGSRWKYEWTVEGQLAAVVRPDGQRWEYEYDPFGRRIRKSGPGDEVEYVWDGGVVAQEIRDGSETATWVYEPDSFRPIAKVENGETYSIVTDAIGTPRELVTSDGRVAWQGKLRAWGDVDRVSVKETDCPIRFQGQWFDEESGLAYNWHRYYEPSTGRYLSPDPIGIEGGTRSWGYAHNPASWVDPSGLDPEPPTTVYRVIRPDENPLTGLSAKNPSATYKPEGHVLHGSRPNFRSQYISTTTDINVARQWAAETGNRIVEIDTTKVNGRVIDLSTPEGRNLNLRGNTARNWAASSSEVLIEGDVPPSAMRQVHPKCGG